MRPTLPMLLFLLPVMALAKPWWMKDSPANEADFLPPDQAFKVSSYVDGALVRVRWDIADGYYLYRKKFDINPESVGLTLDTPQFTPGASHTDPYLGTQEIFEQRVEALVAFHRNDAGAHPIQIKVSYQGCAKAGLCYPLMVKVLDPGSMPVDSAPLSSKASDGYYPGHSMTSPPVPGPGRMSPGAIMLACLAGILAFFLAGLARRTARSGPP